MARERRGSETVVSQEGTQLKVRHQGQELPARMMGSSRSSPSRLRAAWMARPSGSWNRATPRGHVR